MPALEVKLQPDEKAKLISFFENKIIYYNKQAIALKNEFDLLLKIKAKSPTDSKTWNAELNIKITGYEERIKLQKDLENDVRHTITFVNQGSEFIIQTSISTCLKEFYNSEKTYAHRSLSKTLKYYPRLKKAKEASIYDFCNKIKTFLEAKNVKVI